MSKYNSNQISRSASILLEDNLNTVFPLFGPKEEKKWAKGWSPEFIYPKDGIFTENLIFKTRSTNSIEQEFTWILSYLNLDSYKIVYTVFTENRIWTIRITCSEFEKGKTRAEIKYTYTGLNETGDTLNKEALEQMYRFDLKDWEEEINKYLRTGEEVNG